VFALPKGQLVCRGESPALASALVVWARFLDVRGKTLWQATRTDVDAYHRARRDDDAAHRISAASWNRAVAALEKLYRWAVDEGLVAQSPFAYRDIWRRLPSGGRAAVVTRNQAYERAAKRADVKFVTIEDYRCFRDVGLRGLATDRTERPGARDRNGARNALFADLLITTGLRLEEASSLLAVEIEETIRVSASGERQVAFRLPSALTKGDKGRTIRIPASLLARLRSYLEVERSMAVEKFKARGMATRMFASLPCALNGDKIELATKIGRAPLRLDVITPDEPRAAHPGKAKAPARNFCPANHCADVYPARQTRITRAHRTETAEAARPESLWVKSSDKVVA
jgi:integrase